MKIFFLNCNKRYYSSWNDIRESLRRKSIDIKDIDAFILAEACHFNPKSEEFEVYDNTKKYKNALKIFSKKTFNEPEEIKYIVENDIIKKRYPDGHHRYRLLNFIVDKIRITAVHVDHGWYNFIAMKALEASIEKFKSDIIIGDFNSGYISDCLDVQEGGLIFQNGLLFFSKYETLGYTDPLKNSDEYTFINKRSNRKFRIDHCFIKKTSNYEVKYIDTLDISDHKGILVTI